MRSTLIIGTIGATALTIGLGVGITFATGDPSPPAPTAPTTMMDAASDDNSGHVPDIDDMTSMMGGGLTAMMDADGMDAMHTAMHESLRGSVSADVLASCDAAHASMGDGVTPTSTDAGSRHAEHHPGSQR